MSFAGTVAALASLEGRVLADFGLRVRALLVNLADVFVAADARFATRVEVRIGRTRGLDLPCLGGLRRGGGLAATCALLRLRRGRQTGDAQREQDQRAQADGFWRFRHASSVPSAGGMSCDVGTVYL